MINSSKFLKRIFRRVNGLVWDVVSGGVGLQTADGIYTVSFNEAGDPSLNVNPVDGLGLALPAFATQATFEEVNQGDLVCGDSGIIGWVVSKTDAAFRVIDHTGHVKQYVPPKVAIFGTNGVLVVRNLMSLTGGAAGASSFASNLLPLMMLGGGDEKLEKILPFLLMTSQAAPAANGTPAAANPMASLLPLLLMKDGLGGKGDGGIDPMMLMMMSGGLGGGAGGMNPMLLMALAGKGGDLFGGSEEKAVPALAPVTRGGVPVLNRI